MSEQQFTWLNEPASNSISGSQKSAEGYKITQVEARSKPATDFWRKPPSVHRDTGHFYYVTVEGDFHISCTFQGEWITQYDQAGLMCRVNSQKWIKAGIEYDENKTFAR
jgi:regulation of enolase protein 1 (concanavalin A-like superfamily)